MNKIVIFILAFTFSLPAFAREIQIDVQGMVCGFCTQGIAKKFSALKAVKNVDVNFESAKVRIALNKGFDLSDLEIQDLLQDAGFSAGQIIRE